MARSLRQCVTFGNGTPISTTTTAFFFLIAFFAVCSLVSLLCATHQRSKSRRQNEKNAAGTRGSDQKLATSISNIRSKAVRMAKMISWKRDEVVEDEEAVWKKTILMGDRCRPLDFSGRILYDSEGHQLLIDSRKTASAAGSGSTQIRAG